MIQQTVKKKTYYMQRYKQNKDYILSAKNKKEVSLRHKQMKTRSIPKCLLYSYVCPQGSILGHCQEQNIRIHKER